MDKKPKRERKTEPTPEPEQLNTTTENQTETPLTLSREDTGTLNQILNNRKGKPEQQFGELHPYYLLPSTEERKEKKDIRRIQRELREHLLNPDLTEMKPHFTPKDKELLNKILKGMEQTPTIKRILDYIN